MQLKPIKHENLKMLIELEVKNYIETNELKHGDRLPAEKDLAEALGASRTAVRESLRGLESLGFVESVHGVGWQVKQFDFDALLRNLPYGLDRDTQNFREVLEVRLVLEHSYLMRDLDKFSTEDSARLNEIVDKMEATINADRADEELNEINAEFHAALYENSGNAFLQGLMGTFANIQRRLSNSNPYRIKNRTEFLKVHRALVSALESHDAETVEKAFDDHFAEVHSWVRDRERG